MSRGAAAAAARAWAALGLLLVGAAQASCSLSGEDCRATRCCARAEERCYAKDEWWASCRQSCEVGMTAHEDDPPKYRTPWGCKELLPCAGRFDDCRETRCCQQPGAQCFEKNAEWAQCKPGCKAGESDPSDLPQWRTPWTCAMLLPDLGPPLRALRRGANGTAPAAPSTPDLKRTAAAIAGVGKLRQALETVRAEVRSEMRDLKQEVTPNATVSAGLQQIEAELRGLKRSPGNWTVEEKAAPAAAARVAPLRGMAAAPPKASVASASESAEGPPVEPPGRAPARWAGPAAMGLSAALAFACMACLLAPCQRRRQKAAGKQAVVPAEEEPLVKAQGAPGSTNFEDTWATSHSLASVLEGQLATLTSELSTLRTRSRQLEAKCAEAESQRGGHIEERKRLLGELEATTARADEAERARAALIEEQLRAERDRLAPGARKNGKCGCCVQ